MKILIVDDEKHVINTIRLLIPTQKLGITEILTAQSCAAAKVILDREKPEIAIVDIIMQKETGMSLLSYVRGNQLKTKMIAISGHSDYEYVRTMLLGGAVDYLLKPVESNALISSIQKAQKLILDEEKKKPEKRETVPVFSPPRSNQYIRTLLRRLLRNGDDHTTMAELSSLLSSAGKLDNCVLVYYDLNYMPINNRTFSQHLMMFEAKAKEYLSISQCGFFMDGFRFPQEHLILIDDNVEHLKRLEMAAVSVFKMTGLEFSMGMADHIHFPQAFAKGFERAKEAFFQIDFMATPEVLQKYSDAPSRDSKTLGAAEKRKLLSAVIVQDKEQIVEIINRWIVEHIGNVSEKRPTLGKIRDFVEAFSELYRCFIEKICEKYPAFPEEDSEKITYASFLDEYFRVSGSMMAEAVCQSLQSLSDRFATFSASEESFLRIAFYMELNYDAPFNQAEYAQLFHVHKDYLSRRFKHVFGEGMINYMNRIRIAHAEKLMRETDLKIREIAYSTGFGDEKYFSRQFKCFTKSTPSEYRAMIRDKQKL